MTGISMRELAKRLDVSVASVSVALRGKPGISDRTRQRILDEAARLGYDMSRLSTVQPKGIIEILDYTYYDKPQSKEELPLYYSLFIKAVRESLAEYGYSFSGPWAITDPAFRSRPEADGCIILGARMTLEDIALYMDSPKPVVISGPMEHYPVTCISHDNRCGMLFGIRHLIDLGHRKIGYVYPSWPSYEPRRQAFADAMDDCGLVPAEYISFTPCNTTDGTFVEHILAALNTRFDTQPPKATAYLCDNDYCAIALMRALREHGRIPGKQVSVVGFDDIPLASVVEPPLTSIRTYEEQLGTACVQQIIYSIEHPDFSFRHIKLGTKLIIRSSTCKAPVTANEKIGG